VLRDTASGTLYLHLLDGFLEAPALAGPWTMAKSVPPHVGATAAKLAKEGVVDLIAGPSDDKDPKKKPSLKNGVPRRSWRRPHRAHRHGWGAGLGADRE
jgi:hypothetical protein